MILSSHQLNEVEQVCDSVAILARGHLLARGKVHDLLSRTASIRLRTTDDTRAEVVLSALPSVAEVRNGDGYLVMTAPAERAWELSRSLAQQDIFINELTPVQVSLEEYFLEVTSEAAPGDPLGAPR